MQEKRKKAYPPGKSLDLKVNTQRSNESPRGKFKDKESPLTKSPGLKLMRESSTGRKSNSPSGSPNRFKNRSPFKTGDALNIDLESTLYLNASPNTKMQMNQLQLDFNEKMKMKIEKELKDVQKPQNRKLKISSDDPFSNIFIKDVQYEKKGDKALREAREKREE